MGTQKKYNATILNIDIYHFRSIKDAFLRNCKCFNIIYGKNDTGKSNVLKALNLFFNNNTDWRDNYSYDIDYNLHRRATGTKQKRSTIIEVKFSAKKDWTFTKKWFKVRREWDMYGEVKNTYYDYKRREVTDPSPKGAITKYLKRLKYVYVPALRGRAFLEELYSMLNNALLNEHTKSIEPQLKNLNIKLTDVTNSLTKEFREATGIETDLNMPTSMDDLYKRLQAVTVIPYKNKQHNIKLEKRGDGIQSRYISSLLHFISDKDTSNTYIWGFEEPENSLEYNLSKMLAELMLDKYCKSTQIFATTHSPAFIALKKSDNKDRLNVFITTKTKDGLSEYSSANDNITNESFITMCSEVDSLYSEYINATLYDAPYGDYNIIVEGENDKNTLVHLYNIVYPANQISADEPFKFILKKGKSDDDNPNSGSWKRMHLASIIKEKGKRVMIMEDRDDTDNRENRKNYPFRVRTTRRNLDSYFLDPRLVSYAHGTSEEEIEKYYKEEGFIYSNSDNIGILTIDGKKLTDGLRKKYANNVYVYEIVKHITSIDEIHEDILVAVEHMHEMIHGNNREKIRL